jgi:hypothetical protein
MKRPEEGEHLLYPWGYFAVEVLPQHGLHFGPGLLYPGVVGDDDAFPGEIGPEGGEGLQRIKRHILVHVNFDLILQKLPMPIVKKVLR